MVHRHSSGLLCVLDDIGGVEMITPKEQVYISRLERRADHLARRIAESRAKGKVVSYDEAELSALNWAIGLLCRILPSSGRP